MTTINHEELSIVTGGADIDQRWSGPERVDRNPSASIGQRFSKPDGPPVKPMMAMPIK